uniref:Uncharacterized protein n=1 Tax=Arundo donax TaxID=35708 RepID=A0A0A8Z785_ARUDO
MSEKVNKREMQSSQVRIVTEHPLQAGGVLDEELIELTVAAQDLEACRPDMDAAALVHVPHPQALRRRAVREQSAQRVLGDLDIPQVSLGQE